MRRNVSLYIADSLVDIDEQTLILLNYTMEDLNNPTIVRNSYSQQITLKGTPENNAIFGSIYRLDSRFSPESSSFNPLRKTPFSIYANGGELLETGYVKLDSIEQNGADIQYKVTLYGGLGSFLYSLSYDADGNKKNLASLDYLGTDNPKTELDFTINADTIRTAWRTLISLPKDPRFNIVNFAPAYNGIPDGNFSADKAIGKLSEVGLESHGMQTKDGYTLMNFAQGLDEWAVRDFRSYLQRPVVSMKAIWDAVAKPENNGGYTLDKSLLNSADWLHFNDMWVTLPLIPSLGSAKKTSGDLSLSWGTGSGERSIGRVSVIGDSLPGTETETSLQVRIGLDMPEGAYSYANLSRTAQTSVLGVKVQSNAAFFVQAVAYSANGVKVGGSRIACVGTKVNGAQTGSDLARALGYKPTWEAEYGDIIEGNTFSLGDRGLFYYDTELTLDIKAQDVAYYELEMVGYAYNTRNKAITNISTGVPATLELYHSFTEFYISNSITADGSGSITATNPSTLRSGATITKDLLFSTSGTPADYILSFCKMFGLSLVYDSTARKVTVTKRNALYRNNVIDLTDRVDLSRGRSLRPFVFDRKWYDFRIESVGGAFADEYRESIGTEYGLQRVNTGYDFNTESTNLMESVIFKNGITVLERSKYFNTVRNGTRIYPSVFLDRGNTYTLWNASGDSVEYDIALPGGCTVTPFNEDFENYDLANGKKMQFHDGDGKPIDGSGVLVLFDRVAVYDGIISDDVPSMSVLNNGQPCWLLGTATTITMPMFIRYRIEVNGKISESLDFGKPKVLDIPGTTYGDGLTIYERCWKDYLTDRYDVNTKVMVCSVDFTGIQVNADLLRNFYFFGNSLWALNAIRNYSVTTFDAVECEFIKVQDKTNYTNGQR